MQKNTRSMKNELGARIVKELITLRTKICSYFIDDGYINKKIKSSKKCVMKRKITFEDYKTCLEKNFHREN